MTAARDEHRAIRRYGVAVLAWLFCACVWTPVQACTGDMLRKQHTLLVMLTPKGQKPLLPQELNMVAGDLVAMYVPKDSTIEPMQGPEKAPSPLQKLDKDTYLSLGREGGGKPASDLSVMGPPSFEWRYFVGPEESRKPA